MQQRTLFKLEGPVAGVDEAGRGPLAGPVVAAAVILAPGQDPSRYRDSKTLSAATRERLAADIRAHALDFAIAWADRAEIDALNILNATMLAMRRAILGLRVAPATVQVDGNRLPDLRFNGRVIDGIAEIRGDSRIASIAAASILAKTARDRMMTELDALYPDYAFARHKGYATAVHRDRIERFGPCVQHRRSFAPLKVSS